MGERPRTYADVSKLNMNMSEIKYRAVNATMDIPTNLKAVSDESTYLNVLSAILRLRTRPRLSASVWAPTSFAFALAYSPMRCIGVTPSIQVLSQVRSFFAVRMKDAYMNNNAHVPTTGVMKRNEDTAKFATILRRSCTCTQAGVVCLATNGICCCRCGPGLFFVLIIANLVHCNAFLLALTGMYWRVRDRPIRSVSLVSHIDASQCLPPFGSFILHQHFPTTFLRWDMRLWPLPSRQLRRYEKPLGAVNISLKLKGAARDIAQGLL